MPEEPPLHTCLNCGAPVRTKYCGECGQEAKPPVLSFRELFSSTIDNYLSLDSKLLRSLRPLFFRPGKLSEEYVRGRRESYVSPIRLYLVSTLLFFLVAAFAVDRSETGFLTIDSKTRPPAEADRSETGFLRIKSTPPPSTEADADSPVDDAVPDSLAGTASSTDSVVTSEPTTVDPDPAGADSSGRATERSFAQKLFETDPQVISAVFLRQLPRVLFVLLPVFALLLKLIYIRRKRFYIEHLVFALHTHALIFLIATPAALIQTDIAGAALAILSLLYLYVSMKRFYSQGWFKTFLKSALLLVAYISTIAPAMIIALGLTVMFALD